MKDRDKIKDKLLDSIREVVREDQGHATESQEPVDSKDDSYQEQNSSSQSSELQSLII